MSITNFKWTGILSIAFLLAVAGCSKKELSATNNGNTPPPTGTASQLLADSMYLYAQQVYYWNTQLPNYQTFNPRQYVNANDSLGLANEQFAYTRIPKDANGNIYEQRVSYDQYGTPHPDNTEPKFSYIEYTSQTINGGTGYEPFRSSFSQRTTMQTLDGKDNSLGLVVGFIPASLTYDSTTASNKDSTVGLVRFVIKGSPADQAGLKRGNVILKYNDNAWSYDNNLSDITNALKGNTLKLMVYDPYMKDTTTVPIQKGVYTYNPIFKSTVLSFGGHKIGYLSFYTFSDSLKNAGPVLDTAFNSFANQGVTDMVVDLRYNGGGYVNTAQHLVELLVPSSANNKIMFTAYYNQMMVNKQATMLKNVPLDYDNPSAGNSFSVDYSPAAQTTNIIKQGNVSNVSNIYFIVSSGTASASELVINSLKPYANVTQISSDFSDTTSFTYGKPVGFFEIRIGKFSMWTPNFEMKNAQGIGGYYKGLQSKYKRFDDITRDFGDPEEASLAQAIYSISGVNVYQSSTIFNNYSEKVINSTIMKTRSVGQIYRASDMIGKPNKVFN